MGDVNVQSLVERIEDAMQRVTSPQHGQGLLQALCIINSWASDPAVVEAVGVKIANEIGMAEMVLTDPITLRKLQSARAAKAALSVVTGGVK